MAFLLAIGTFNQFYGLFYQTKPYGPLLHGFRAGCCLVKGESCLIPFTLIFDEQNV